MITADNNGDDKLSHETQNNNSSTFILPKKVAVIYTEAKREYFKTEELYITEKDAEREAAIVASYINKLNVETAIFSGDTNLIENLKHYQPEMVFNLVYSVRGSDYLAATVPGILDYLNIPYTGTDFFGFALGTDKLLTKKVLQQFEVPVPNYQLFKTPNDPIDFNIRYPLISKLNETHCAVEIHEDAISENEKHLRERLKFLISTYQQPVLVEEYIGGREFTAIYLEGLNKKVYMGEKLFNKPDQKYQIATFEDQWDDTVPEDKWAYTYGKYEDPNLKEIVKRAAEALKTYDYGKFDIRMDSAGRYYVIDANSNPAFGPKEMQTAISNILDLYDINFIEILRRLMINTIRDSFADFKDSGNS